MSKWKIVAAAAWEAQATAKLKYYLWIFILDGQFDAKAKSVRVQRVESVARAEQENNCELSWMSYLIVKNNLDCF